MDNNDNKDSIANMDYNSQRDSLVIPEYGRNVQNLINHAKSIENPELRQAFINNVVDLIMQMHPQNKNLEDYRDRIWSHIFRISNYELDVLPPSGEQPTPEDARKHPDHVGYPAKQAKYRHYGHNVETLIHKAIDMEDGEVKQGFVKAIAAYMKLAYRTWNQEHYVNDIVIINDLKSMSGGKLSLPEDTSLENLSQQSRSKRSSKQRPPGKSNNNRNSGHSKRKRKRK